MKVTSYDSLGKIIDVIHSDNIVPRHFEFFDRNNSALELFKRVKITCKKDDTFANVLNSTFAESLFNIDYNLFQELPVTPFKMGGKCTCGTFLEAPTFNENNYEPRKLADILNYYGHKSKKQIEIDINSGRIKDIDCLSNSSWIQSLACYANKKTCTYVNRTESKEIAFIIALQSVINRYYLALKNIVNFREISYEDNIFRQIKIMSPFISKNVFRVEPEDVLVYNTNEFIVKLVSNLTTFPEGRIDSYCLLQLLRGDYKPVNKINSNLQLLNFQISTQKIPDVTHTFTIKEFNDNQTVICITDREIESLVYPYIDGNGLDILIQTFNRIYDGYITSYYKQIWDNQISHRKLAVLMPDKIQTWSYLFFDELANYNKIGPTDSLKEQMCFHKLIYSFINCNKPSKILFDGQLISCFFSILKKNNCHNQIGFFEKIYTFNEILVHADFDDINLMNKNENWGKISQYKDKIQAIDEMISFLEPILNSSYVNESVISIDNLKKMIRNIIENKLFINDVLVNRPTQLLKKMGYKYNCNIALILNILGALYDHDIRFKKGISKLLKREPSIAYNELVKPYGIKNDKNNNKYLTQYNKFDTTYSVISYDKEISIIDEMKKSKYYK